MEALFYVFNALYFSVVALFYVFVHIGIDMHKRHRDIVNYYPSGILHLINIGLEVFQALTATLSSSIFYFQLQIVYNLFPIHRSKRKS